MRNWLLPSLLQEAKARRAQTQVLRDEAEARLAAHRKKQLVLMNAELEEEMRLGREADGGRLVRAELSNVYEDSYDGDGDDEEDEDEEV